MFLKSKKASTSSTNTPRKKEATPSIITHDLNVLGNIVSEGVVDIDGTLDGNIRCDILTVRPRGVINGEVVANTLLVYGKIKGLIRAKSVHLYSSCHIEGVIMHESLTIEDGAFIDGKCKRTDKVLEPSITQDYDSLMTSEKSSKDLKILENIRLIR